MSKCIYVLHKIVETNAKPDLKLKYIYSEIFLLQMSGEVVVANLGKQIPVHLQAQVEF